ncbi:MULTISPECIES: hypothetical protein [Rhodococcus]|uniref:hypothetical protein n=1 Tax=Rhodococcus TaxID=1827 RepID=UPI001BD4DE1F|nr:MULTISPECIES: hypothetical protein [Rhodococcus]MBS9373132.1 hypothetical protein [Rhodococcus sp. B50]MCD2116714.1 hypothetical protein [Rhodococcus pyridinivorans]MCZ4625342.1 hypothetical protein [Rhodococcus pyridinivorans]MCZ4646552.1 hypothetical protein [Rhodococcus pyridinivorans]MDJ0482390.1 hypothetical protein [Rhodococcus pyridinivorans]
MAPNKADRKVHEGEVLGSVKRNIAAVDGFAALSQLVTAAQECIEIHAVEQTKRTRLHTYATAEVQRIKSAESIVRDYFEQSFAERRTTFDALFSRLDQALEQENSQVISEVLRGIVDIAKTSPLADLGDLGQIRAALDDPDQVWDL